MIEGFLARDEGKTLEFKENCRPLERIVRSAVALANTAGGNMVIGVKDKTKDVVGVADPLVDEERLANAFADGIRPLLVPDIQIHPWRKLQLIVVAVPHAVGPFYVRSEGPQHGVYVRLGSTNRPAGPELLAELQRLARNTFFDEQPCWEMSSEDIDFRAASELSAAVSKRLTPPKQRSLGLLVGHGSKELPSIGAVLLFGKDRGHLFPSATIRCARFLGRNTAKFLDQTGHIYSLLLLLGRSKIESEFAGHMHRWQHSGFSIDQSLFLPAEDKRELGNGVLQPFGEIHPPSCSNFTASSKVLDGWEANCV